MVSLGDYWRSSHSHAAAARMSQHVHSTALIGCCAPLCVVYMRCGRGNWCSLSMCLCHSWVCAGESHAVIHRPIVCVVRAWLTASKLAWGLFCGKGSVGLPVLLRWAN